MRRPILTLTLLAGLTFFLGLGVQAITDSDEAFYAEAAREMVESGDWLTPHFNYEQRWQKPVLYYWVAAGAFAASDSTEFMARLGSAISGLGLVLLTFSAARALTSRVDAAWIAGAIAATCYGCFTMARLALPDLPLAFFITATIWTATRAADAAEPKRLQWAALAGLAAGLGFLDKGPLALVIPAIVIGPIWWRERRSLAARPSPFALRPSTFALAALLFCLAGLPWYIAMYATHGVAYLQSFFLSDNLERFATTRYNDVRAIWYYVPIVVGGLAPWALFLVVLPWRTLRDIVQRRRTLTDAEWRLLIWALAPFLLFTASIGKQPRYILPVLPPVAMMLGAAIADRITSSRHDAAARRELTIATAATSVFFALIALLVFQARILFVSAFAPMTWVGITTVAVAAGALAAVAVSRAWTRLPAVMAVASAALLLTLQFGALTGRRPEAVEQVATVLRLNRFGAEPIGVYEAFTRNLVFYTHVRDVELYDDAGALTFLSATERVFLVLNRRDFERLRPLTTVPLTTLGQVKYLNAAGVRLRTLLAPIPEEDLDTVLVVSNR